MSSYCMSWCCTGFLAFHRKPCASSATCVISVRPDEAVGEVGKGADAAFLLNPVSLTAMRDLCYAGRVMPQKSTDFYPKLLSGLTLDNLDQCF